MKALLVIVLGLFGTWHFIDLHSKSFLPSVIMPLLFLLMLIALAVWSAMRLGPGGGSSDGGSSWGDIDIDIGGSDGGGGD